MWVHQLAVSSLLKSSRQADLREFENLEAGHAWCWQQRALVNLILMRLSCVVHSSVLSGNEQTIVSLPLKHARDKLALNPCC